VSGPLRERPDPVILSAGSPFMERLLQMNVSDQKITSRFRWATTRSAEISR
jgi:hypothetical protein